ncbi:MULTISPECIES: hypothetical protein [unclassified Streptomyces]|uniref:hypothetical protein n=1 Tax=unclassified Streptomyces TaxID=2593676 RepID=UPI002E17A513|nr:MULTISPECIES: hypothetical protein [unclassified Streptomyces]
MSAVPPAKSGSGAVLGGVFVASLFVLVASVLQRWTVLAVLAGAVLLGVLVTAGARHQSRAGRGNDEDRPWRRRE